MAPLALTSICGLPFTVVLGGSGRVLHRKMGQITPQDLQRWAALR